MKCPLMGNRMIRLESTYSWNMPSNWTRQGGGAHVDTESLTCLLDVTVDTKRLHLWEIVNTDLQV